MLGPEVTDALIANEQREVPGADLTQRERQILALMVPAGASVPTLQHMSLLDEKCEPMSLSPDSATVLVV